MPESVQMRRERLHESLRWLDGAGVIHHTDEGVHPDHGTYLITPVVGVRVYLTLPQAEMWVHGAIAAVDALNRRTVEEVLAS